MREFFVPGCRKRADPREMFKTRFNTERNEQKAGYHSLGNRNSSPIDRIRDNRILRDNLGLVD